MQHPCAVPASATFELVSKRRFDGVPCRLGILSYHFRSHIAGLEPLVRPQCCFHLYLHTVLFVGRGLSNPPLGGTVTFTSTPPFTGKCLPLIKTAELLHLVQSLKRRLKLHPKFSKPLMPPHIFNSSSLFINSPRPRPPH